MFDGGIMMGTEPIVEPREVQIEVITVEDEAPEMEVAVSIRKLPCEIKHSIRGRLRIAVPPLARKAELVDCVKKCLLTMQGINDVDSSCRCGQFTISYDPRQIKRSDILGSITGMTIHDLERLKDELPDVLPEQEKEIPKEPARKEPSFLEKNEKLLAARMPYQVSHSMHGRLRIAVPLLAGYEHLIRCVEHCVLNGQGITEVDSNYLCGSITIKYDVEVIKKDDVLQALDGITIKDLILIQEEFPEKVLEDHEISFGYLKLTTAAVALSVAFGALPVVALGVVYPVLIYVSIPVFQRAYRCVKKERRLNVDFLDAAALTAAMLTGDVINASSMCWLIHLGDHIRDLTASSSHRTIRKLLDFQENYAWVVRGEVEVKVKVKEILEGEVVALNVGNLIPVDGEIIEGELIVDQQVLTGESLPVHKEFGDTVLASTVIKDGKAYVRVTRTGDNTKVAQVVRMVEEAPIYETKIQNHAERMADRIVAPSLVTTCLIAASTMNLYQLAALLTVDFGTGIRVSAPTAVLSSMIASVSHGILIKGGSYLEKLCQVDTIVFDKTGTLTTGIIQVEDTFTFNGHEETELLAYAATAEIQMTHPIAEAVVNYAAERDIPLKPRDQVKYWVGRGVEAGIEGKRILVGSLRLLKEHDIPIDPSVDTLTDRYVHEGKACLYVSVDQDMCGIITFRDQIRKEAKQMIEELHRVGVKQVIMLTGDVKKLAVPVARTLGIDRCIAEVLPEEKAQVIMDLKNEGHIVAFVGDGINDSVGLSYADIGISVRGGADITKETAGVILLDDNLHKIPMAFEISKQTIRLIKENYWITGVFNVFAYVMAAFGLLSPVMTTLLSNGSAVVACVNGMKPVIKLKLKSGSQTESALSIKENAALIPSLKR